MFHARQNNAVDLCAYANYVIAGPILERAVIQRLGLVMMAETKADCVRLNNGQGVAHGVWAYNFLFWRNPSPFGEPLAMTRVSVALGTRQRKGIYILRQGLIQVKNPLGAGNIALLSDPCVVLQVLQSHGKASRQQQTRCPRRLALDSHFTSTWGMIHTGLG